jgi:hypothetical protein
MQPGLVQGGCSRRNQSGRKPASALTERPRSDGEAATRAEAARLGEVTAFQYAVKFLCGSASESGDLQQVTKGVFFTLINVHNPSLRRVTFSWKVVVETRLAILLDPPQISSFRSVSVNSNSAVKMDASDLFSVATGSGAVIVGGSPLVMGYAVIVSPVELDVTVLYTARPQQGDVTSIDVETIHPRTMTVPQSAHSNRESVS